MNSFQSLLCHLILVSPRWDIYVWWVLYRNTYYYYASISSESSVTWFWWVLIGIYMSGESSTDVHTTTTATVTYILVWIYFHQLLLCTRSITELDFGESSLEYTCLVSPNRNTIHTYIYMIYPVSPPVTWFWWVLVGIYKSGESFTTRYWNAYYVYISNVSSVRLRFAPSQYFGTALFPLHYKCSSNSSVSVRKDSLDIYT